MTQPKTGAMKNARNFACLHACLGIIMFVMLGAECALDPTEPDPEQNWVVVDLKSDEFKGKNNYFDYFVAEENSFDFFMVKHQNGIPTEVHYKPNGIGDGDKPGISVFCDQSGFPHISVIDGHIIVMNKLQDNKHVDVAIVYPDSSIKVHKNVEMPFVWNFSPDKAEYSWESVVRWSGRALSVAACIASIKATWVTGGLGYKLAIAACTSATLGFVSEAADYQTMGTSAVIVGLALEAISTFVGGVSNPGQAIPAIMSLSAIVVDWVAGQLKEAENKPTGTAQNRIGVGVSLNGRWRRSDGLIVNVSGSNGYFDTFGSTWQHVANAGFVKIGSLKFSNIMWRWSSQRGGSEQHHYTFNNLWFNYSGGYENVHSIYWSNRGTMDITNNNNTLTTNDSGRTHTHTRLQ